METSSAEPVSPDSEEPAAQLTLDIDDPADRALINRALTWMAQALSGGIASGDLQNDTHVQMLVATQYLGISDRASWEEGEYPEVESASVGASGVSNVRVSADLVTRAVERFFGCEPDYSALDDDPMYAYEDGYVYFGTTAPVGQTGWYAAAREAEDLGDGRYLVSFGAVITGMPYEEHDEDFYAQEYGALMGSLDQPHPDYSTEAIVRVEVVDGEKTVVFESWGTGQDDGSSQDSVHGDISIETPYYCIDIPADWFSDYEIDYDVDENMYGEEAGEGVQGIGCMANVTVGSTPISVGCFTDDWGPQGDFVAAAVGSIPALPGWHIVVTSPNPASPGNRQTDPDVSDEMEVFASFVTPAGEFADSEQSAEASETDAPDFQSQLEAIISDKAADARMGGTTAEMIEAGNEHYECYDALMNEVYAYLDARSDIDSAALAASQDEWVAALTAQEEATKEEYAGGSLMPLAVLGVAMDAREQRIWELLDMI